MNTYNGIINLHAQTITLLTYTFIRWVLYIIRKYPFYDDLIGMFLRFLDCISR